MQQRSCLVKMPLNLFPTARQKAKGAEAAGGGRGGGTPDGKQQIKAIHHPFLMNRGVHCFH